MNRLSLTGCDCISSCSFLSALTILHVSISLPPSGFSIELSLIDSHLPVVTASPLAIFCQLSLTISWHRFGFIS
ncbi:unnamed protein product, partial [Sphenostylis stenocarpa]